jgi:hemoglobin
MYVKYRFWSVLMSDADPAAITEQDLTRLVALFYGRVRQDPALGPIFNDAITDWPHHLSKLTDFWHSVMLTSGRYKGNPMLKHLIHRARITPAHFDRWLALWAEASNEVMAPDAAAALQAKAARIAESLKLALFYRPELDAPKTRTSA